LSVLGGVIRPSLRTLSYLAVEVEESWKVVAAEPRPREEAEVVVASTQEAVAAEESRQCADVAVNPHRTADPQRRRR
jgi:hypothetical protein